MPSPERWWEIEGAARRFVTDLVAGELDRLRPGGELPARPWPDDLRLGRGGLECDSLELMSLATAVAEAVQMHRSGFEDYLLARRTIADWVAIVTSSLGEFSAELRFLSSGTTGAPSSSAHDLRRLLEEVREFAAVFGPRRRVMCAVPAHHIYGFLFSVLLPAELDLPVIDVRSSSTAALATELEDGDLLVGHPAFWHAFVRTVSVVPAGVIGVTSTAPCPAETARAVVEQGVERLIQIYGSSETSGIGWRERPEAAYRLLPYWRRGAEGSLLRRQPDGSETLHLPPDHLAWTDARSFWVTGRRDGAVQIGGINVDPSAVSARLREHPAVADAAVRPMRPDEGSRLKAFIVPRAEGSDDRRLTAELTAWCNAQLAVAERPKAFTFGSALPRNELGKPADWPLPGREPV